MKAVSGKVFARLLEKKGWVLQRINGSHHIYTKEGMSTRISVPIHGNRPLKVGLMKHFMKLADIRDDEL